ncbi:MAG TPA: EamA family transporter [Nocardioidaceae bacterium]|nr:EamA family transporter [Nocardioidaceae bacterium]
MAILLALLSALAYGLSDFVGGFLSRRTTAWAVAVVAQLSSTICTLAVALFAGGSPTSQDFMWAVVAGAASGVGTGFLYRGFSAGRMSVVAPVSAVGAALVPVLAGTFGGERLSLLVWCGIGFALPGIWLVSSSTGELPASGDGPDGSGGATTPRRASTAEGLLDGVLAGLGFGSLFAALGQVPDEAGLWPLAATQAVSIPSVILLAVGLRAAWVPRGRTVWWALLAGPLGASATGAFLLATHSGFLTVAGVLASLYPATTVLLAALVLHEKIHRAQGVGLGLCALAIVLVAGG